MKSSAARIIRASEREERPLPKPRGWDPLSGMIPTPDDLPPYWTGGWVGKRLIEAFAILSRMPERDRPGWAKRSAWPAFPYEYSDVRGWTDEKGEHVWRQRVMSSLERPRIGAASAEVSRMEEALQWPMAYLKEYPGEMRCLLMWALAGATPHLKISRELRARGWSRSTFERRRRDAEQRIADALKREGVGIR